jgi:hypothetical protein
MPPSVGGHEGPSRRESPYFRFRDGKIAYYRGTEDTAQTGAALSS